MRAHTLLLSRLLASILLLALFGGCRSTANYDALQAVAHDEVFAVHAETPETAEYVLALAREALPIVLALPGMQAPQHIDIFVPRVDAASTEGSTQWRGEVRDRNASWIELALGHELAQHRFVIGHELVHLLLDDSWLALPQIVEEGLADRAGEAVDPRLGAARRLAHAVFLCSWTGGGLRVDLQAPQEAQALALHATLTFPIERDELPTPARMLELDEKSYHHVRPAENRQLLYSFGYLLVDRIGVAPLRKLCEQAHAEGRVVLLPAQLFEAARLDPHDLPSWKPAIDALIGPKELLALREGAQGKGALKLALHPEGED